MSLLYAKLSRKCLRSIDDKELSFSSAGIKDVPGDFVGTDTPSILSEHTIANTFVMYVRL